MDNKKKCGKAYFSLLLGVLFIVLFGIFSESYASVESGEIKSYLNILSQSYNGTNATSYKSYLASMSDSNINTITNYINTQLSTWGFSELDIKNCILILEPNGGDFKLNFYFCNNSSPGIYSNLGFFNIKKESNVFYLFMTGVTGDKIPYCYFNYTTSTQSIRSFKFLASYPTQLYFNDSSLTFDSSSTFLIGNAVVGTGIPLGYYENNPAILLNSVGNYQIPVPGPDPEPSGDNSSGDALPGGTITNPSGEVTGKVDLTNIENGIDNINQNLNNIENKIPTSGDMHFIISGETSKITGVLTDSADDLIDNTTITSGDIDDALGFEIAEDPYSNFWLTLTNNLKTALLGSKRSIDISFQGRTWTISLDEYLVLPAWLTIILIPFSTCFFTFMIVRQWKHIFDKLSSGNVDSILQENSEERNF